ncbi:solute carrier organic anion transporter family member 2B1 isoform X2 [Bombyx mori]|uniref:solute carrier organic anion transporter family member 2B1 isoform X2 n=1 Tax=Bombyx mori TaxID=7091 RepID=UPI002ED42F47
MMLQGRTELCGGEPAFRSINPRDENVTPRTGILVLTALLCALTKVSIWAHGLTYLDDHDPTNGPYFYGILISIRLSLGLSGTNWFRPSSVRDDWWEGQLSASMLTMMFAILFTFFPTKMPQWQEEEVTVDTDFLPSLYRVINNRIVVIQSVALSLLTTAIFCYVEYDHAYVQARFHVEALRQDLRTSRFLSDFFRSLVVIFFIMIFRVRFSARRPDGVKANTAARVGGVVAVFVAIFFVVLASLGCDTGTLAGLDEEYVQPECSQQCGCNSARYGFSPVCGLDTLTTYFSPCHAGCRAVEDLNGFSLYADCTCGAQRAALGACALSTCSVPFSIYQIFYTIILAVSGASFLMQGMVLVRAVRRVDKPIAIGFSFALVALLSFVVGRLLYMLISYLTCAYSSGGVCVLHRPTLWAMCATSSAMALGSAVVSLIASKTPLEPTTEL